MNSPEKIIIATERAALDRWGKGDPSSFLEICASDVSYFDNVAECRLDGIEALTSFYEGIRGQVQLDRYDLLNPKVQLCGEAAVLTYNFVGYAGGKAHGWNCTEVYHQSSEGSRIVHTHWSPTKPKGP